jgi:internalin A
MFKFTCAASTKTGKRPVNQDNYMLGNLYAPQDHADLRNNAQGKTDHPFFVAVADGMGGEASGEKASFETVRVLAAVSNRLRNDFESNKRIVHDSVLQANDAICNVMRNENIRSMGSTVVTLLLQDDKCSYTNLGDSRLYMLRNGELVQLTKDHTEGQAMVDAHVLTEEQLKTHPSRNRLSRHLGILREDMMIDTPVYPDITLQDNDKFLICSDGVCGVLSKEEMSKILSMSATTVAKAEILVASSIDAGSRDNVTALVVEIAADEADSTNKVKKQIKQTAKNNGTSSNVFNDDKNSNGIKNKVLVAILCMLFFVVGILVGIGISPKTSKPETDGKENVRPGSSHTPEETPTIYPMFKTEPICTPSELPHEQPLNFCNEDFEKAIREAINLADDKPITIEILNNEKKLDLSEKGLSNISDISALANLTNLQTLNLSGNSISDIGALANLTNLTELNLSGNKIISDISALRNLTNLQTLNLSNNNISDIGALASLTNLQTLYLSNNNISDISALGGLTNLTELDWSYNKNISIGALANLPNLQTLDLSGNGIISIGELGSLPNLQTLNLSSNNISDISALGNLTNLQTLNWSYNKIIYISTLRNLTNLQTLNLSGNNISDISALRSLTNLQTLKTLHLSGNKISDISALANLTNLQTLDLSGNGISDISALESLTNLKTLKTLHLSSNKISDISALANLTNLQTLYLSNNNISDVSLLGNLLGLRWLYLGKNKLAEQQVEELRRKLPQAQIILCE